MRSAVLLCVLLGLFVGTAFAATSKYAYARGKFDSRNVVLENGVVGRLGLDGTGEATVTYFSQPNTLQVFWTYTYSGFGTITATLHVPGFEVVTLSDVSSSYSNFLEYSFDDSDREDAFIAAIRSGNSWIQLASTLYPDGLARANLDNFDQIGTSTISFSAKLDNLGVDPIVATAATATVSARYRSDINQFRFSVKGKVSSSEAPITRVDIRSTITGQVIYSFDINDNSESFIVGANLATFNIMNSGLAEAIAFSANHPNGYIAGPIVPRKMPLSYRPISQFSPWIWYSRIVPLMNAGDDITRVECTSLSFSRSSSSVSSSSRPRLPVGDAVSDAAAAARPWSLAAAERPPLPPRFCGVAAVIKCVKISVCCSR